MNGKAKTGLLIMIICTLLFSFAASAKWVAKDDGTYTYVNNSGKELKTIWLKEANAGIVKNGYYYCLDMNGKKMYGLVKNGDDIYYFHKKNGHMYISKRKKVDGKYYYFGTDGKAVIGQWVGKRYYGGDGVMVTKTFVGKRYVGSNGQYVTGLKKINGYYYYFNKKTGNKLCSTSKTINGKTYQFDENGKCKVQEASVPVHDTYYTDPQVSDEELLAAIIYAEAGNQPYYGQVAVGLVITNRVRSSQFPNTIKEVIYANMQFEPARNGSLTRALEGKLTVTESCKKAAKEVLQLYAANKYTITKSNGKTTSMKGYLFFMTKAAYARLGLKSKTKTLQDHVFFKTWER